MLVNRYYYYWAENIHMIFQRSGFEEVYILKEKADLNIIKDASFQDLKEKWAAEIWNKLKLKTYSLIKNEFGVENYVKYNEDLCVPSSGQIFSLSILKQVAGWALVRKTDFVDEVITVKLKMNFFLLCAAHIIMI